MLVNFHTQRFIIFDCETEGLNLINSRPWQIAYAIYEGKKLVEEKDCFLDWENLNISDGAKKVSGFSWPEYNRKKQPPREVLMNLRREFDRDDTFVCGQNILGFDIFIFNLSCNLLGIDNNYNYLDRCLDSKPLFASIVKGIEKPKEQSLISWQFQLTNIRDRKLKTSQLAMLKYFDIDYEESKLHDALYDIQKNWEIFQQIFYKLD